MSRNSTVGPLPQSRSRAVTDVAKWSNPTNYAAYWSDRARAGGELCGTAEWSAIWVVDSEHYALSYLHIPVIYRPTAFPGLQKWQLATSMPTVGLDSISVLATWSAF